MNGEVSKGKKKSRVMWTDRPPSPTVSGKLLRKRTGEKTVAVSARPAAHATPVWPKPVPHSICGGNREGVCCCEGVEDKSQGEC